jgi:hypothetical protein
MSVKLKFALLGVSYILVVAGGPVVKTIGLTLASSITKGG